VAGFSGSGANYTLTLLANAAGAVTISLPAGVATDLAGANSLASNTLQLNASNPGGGGGGGGGGGSQGIDLALSMSVDRNTVGQYEHLTFTLLLENSGNQDATGVNVAFPKPANYAFTSDQNTRGTYSDWTGVWTVGQVAAGETVSLEVTLFTLTADQRTAFAQVSSADQADADSTPGNASAGIAVEDDEASVNINGGGGGAGGGGSGGGGGGGSGGGGSSSGVDLAISLTSTQTGYAQYEPVPYEVSLTNTGTAAATDVVVSFPFPDNFRHTSNDPASGRFDVWLNEWIVGSLAPGQTTTLRLVLFPMVADVPVTAFVEVSQQSGGQDADSSPGNGNGSSATEDDEAALTLNPRPRRNGVGARQQLVVHAVDRMDLPDLYRITFTCLAEAKVSAQLVDALGRPVRQIELSGADGTHRVEFSTAGLASGMYFLSVVTNGRARAWPVGVWE
jgi:hypothetical protein